MSGTEEEIAEEMSPDEIEQAAEEDENGAQDRDGAQEDAQPEAAAAPRSQEEIEALNRKLEAEAVRHSKRVAEIMGDDFQLLIPSPVDWTPGFLFNVPGMLPEPEQVAALDAILGRAGLEDFVPAEDVEPCEKCNALGRTLTGSRVEGQQTKPCAKCSGSGFQTKIAPLAPVPPIDYNVNASSAGVIVPNQPIAADRYGRPYGHPHYGLEPANVGV